MHDRVSIMVRMVGSLEWLGQPVEEEGNDRVGLGLSTRAYLEESTRIGERRWPHV